MGVSVKHIRHQWPVISALGKSAAEAARQWLGYPAPPPPLPGPLLRATVPARNADLVRSYIRHVGGEPRAYRGVLPPHFFPQWGFPLVTQTLSGIEYPLLKALNGGCRMTVNGPLPADEPLQLTAQLLDIDDNGRRALIHQRLTTGPARAPDTLVVDFYPVVPLRGDRSSGGKKPKRDKARVPDDVREIATFALPKNAGLDFALLTGDFNPIHWIAPAAKAMGFKHTILHGFATMARAIEGLTQTVWAGDPRRLASIDVRFTRPLVLPKTVRLFVDGTGGIVVGDAPGGPAYLVGSVTATPAEKTS